MMFIFIFEAHDLHILSALGVIGDAYLPYRAKLCRAKLSSGETIRRAKFSSLKENSSLSPDKKFRPKNVKVSLNIVQVNLRGKQVI